jgi:hypothetical protein
MSPLKLAKAKLSICSAYADRTKRQLGFALRPNIC